MRLFLYRPGALGDALLCAPLLGGLGRAGERPEVTLAAHGGAATLLAASGLVSEALDQDSPLLTALFADSDASDRLARLGQFDAALAWLADPDGLVLANLRRLAPGRAAVAPSRPELAAGLSVASYLASSLAPLGLAPAALPLPPLLRPAPADDGWAASLLAELPAGPSVALHPGSGGARKNWHAAGFAAAACILASRYTVLLVVGPADDLAARAVSELCPARLWPLAGLPVGRLAAVLARCSAFVGNDSGVGHLAALLGTPVVSLFGPTDRRLWRPWGEKVTVLSWAAGHASLAPETVVQAVRRAVGN